MDTRQVTGGTRLFPIIGNPVDRVVSPPSVNSWFGENGVDAVMTPIGIAAAALPAFWTLLRSSPTFLGCSVTFPHKQAACRAVDVRTERACRLGAINTVRRNPDGTLAGEATDGLATCAAIQAAGIDLRGGSVRIVGAGGGAGLSIVDALCEAGVAELALEEIDARRLKVAMGLVRNHWPNVRMTESSIAAEILINASTLGMRAGDAVPFARDEVRRAICVCDIIVLPDSPLVQLAGICGTAVIDGPAVGKRQVGFQMNFIHGDA